MNFETSALPLVNTSVRFPEISTFFKFDLLSVDTLLAIEFLEILVSFVKTKPIAPLKLNAILGLSVGDVVGEFVPFEHDTKIINNEERIRNSLINLFIEKTPLLI